MEQAAILVTGAGGYIGTTLVPSLLADGHRVRAVDRFFFGRAHLPDHPRLEIVHEDSRRLQEQHFQGIDAVVDLVAVSNDPSGEAFSDATWQINAESRIRTARLAREAGVRRYLLPSSCSIYGNQPPGRLADEVAETNPLTTYARANEAAEAGVLPLADEDFCVAVLRQATVYGLSPRMRFDLAINGMTFGAWKHGRLPLMRDGSQWRPMLHVRDAAAAIAYLMAIPASRINGEIFNVGSAANNYRIGELGELVARWVPGEVEIEWYGDPDTRSYRVDFTKIEALGFQARRTAEDGVREICAALEAGETDRTPETITLEWYQMLQRWMETIRAVEMYDGILEI